MKTNNINIDQADIASNSSADWDLTNRRGFVDSFASVFIFDNGDGDVGFIPGEGKKAVDAEVRAEFILDDNDNIRLDDVIEIEGRGVMEKNVDSPESFRELSKVLQQSAQHIFNDLKS